jgi:hypothetical protein
LPALIGLFKLGTFIGSGGKGGGEEKNADSGLSLSVAGRNLIDLSPQRTAVNTDTRFDRS